MLRTLSWLIRAGAYVLIGVDVFTGASFGPVALPVTATAFALCGALLAGWAVLERRLSETGEGRVDRTVALTVVLGLITALSAAVAVQPGANTLVALAAIAVIDAGTESRLTAGWAVLGTGVLAAEIGALVTDPGATTALGIPLVLVISLLMGLNRRSYRVRAEQTAVLLAQAEKLRAEQRRVAVLDERTRIAREIHDVLAHSLGALGIQIQAARALLTDHQDTGRAIEVLTVAQRMASDGLGETRRAVHALRTDTPPLYAELARMAATHEQRHGSTVTLAVTGDAQPLPPDQALALARTAQESLTNAAKHAPHRPVTVDLRYGDEDVTLTLSNPLGHPPGRPPGDPLDDPAGDPAGRADGPERERGDLARGPGDPAPFATVDGGYGLTGMRERLLLLGGTLAAGAADGRWTVTARVPSAGRGRA